MGVLRLALAISVMCWHMGVVRAHTNTILGCTFLDGEIAVETFFVISGFYMAMVLHEKYVGTGSYLIFLTQRILRLCPTYLVSLLITLMVFGLLVREVPSTYLASRSLFFWADHYHQTKSLTLFLIGLCNFFCIGLSELFYFSFDDKTGWLGLWNPLGPKPVFGGESFLIIPPAWSVSLEIYFYFLAPMLVRCSIWLQLLIISASVALRYSLTGFFHFYYDPFVYRNFFCQLCFFMIGSLCYQFYSRNKNEIQKRVHPWRHGLWILFVLMLFYRRLPWEHQLYLVTVPIMILLVPILFTLTRNNRLDRQLGELSYPFYLTHFLVIVVAYYLHSYLWKVVVGPVCLLSTLALSWLLYRYVESLTERYRAHLYHRQHPNVHLSSEFFPPEALQKNTSS